jgi:hypothetical protein
MCEAGARIHLRKEQKGNKEQKRNTIEDKPMENETLRDVIGLGVLMMVIGASQMWGALLGG